MVHLRIFLILSLILGAQTVALSAPYDAKELHSQAMRIFKTPFTDDAEHLRQVQPLLTDLLKQGVPAQLEENKIYRDTLWYLIFREKYNYGNERIYPQMRIWLLESGNFDQFIQMYLGKAPWPKRGSEEYIAMSELVLQHIFSHEPSTKDQFKNLILFESSSKNRQSLLHDLKEMKTPLGFDILEDLLHSPAFTKRETPESLALLSAHFYENKAKFLAEKVRSREGAHFDYLSELKKFTRQELAQGSKFSLEELFKIPRQDIYAFLIHLPTQVSSQSTQSWFFRELPKFEARVAIEESKSSDAILRKKGFFKIHEILTRTGELDYYEKAPPILINEVHIDFSAMQAAGQMLEREKIEIDLLKTLASTAEGKEELKAIVRSAPKLKLRHRAADFLLNPDGIVAPALANSHPSQPLKVEIWGVKPAEIKTLTGLETPDELAKINWKKTTFVLDPHGTSNTEWLKIVEGPLVYANRPYKIIPGSKEHAQILSTLFKKSHERAGRGCVGSELLATPSSHQ